MLALHYTVHKSVCFERIYIDFDDRSLSMSLKLKTEDHWSCIAHLSAEDTLKSEVVEEMKFKYSPWAGGDDPLRPNFFMPTGWSRHFGHLLQV